MEDTQTLKRQILEKGIKALLDEAKVPQRIHLQVIKALADRVEVHKKDIELHHAVVARHERHMEEHEAYLSEHKRQIDAYDSTVQDFMARDWTGEKGDEGYTPIKGVDYADGLDGKDADEDKIIEVILSKIPVPENGKNGRNGFDGEDGQIELKKVTKLIIKMIKDEQLLDLTHIKGAQKFIKDGVSYKIEELMHGGGSKGDSFAVLTPMVGIVDGFNKVFTFATAPNVIVLDNGNAMNKVSSDGTINWTGTTTVTLNQTPNFNIFAY